MSNVFAIRVLLTLMWVALWESFHVSHLVVGYLLAIAITKLFSHFRPATAAPAPSETVTGG